MAAIPTTKAVRRSDGTVVVVNAADFNGTTHTKHGVDKVAKQGRRPLASAPRSFGQPAEFNGRIG